MKLREELINTVSKVHFCSHFSTQHAHASTPHSTHPVTHSLTFIAHQREGAQRSAARRGEGARGAGSARCPRGGGQGPGRAAGRDGRHGAAGQGEPSISCARTDLFVKSIDAILRTGMYVLSLIIFSSSSAERGAQASCRARHRADQVQGTAAGPALPGDREDQRPSPQRNQEVPRECLCDHTCFSLCFLMLHLLLAAGGVASSQPRRNFQAEARP